MSRGIGQFQRSILAVLERNRPDGMTMEDLAREVSDPQPTEAGGNGSVKISDPSRPALNRSGSFIRQVRRAVQGMEKRGLVKTAHLMVYERTRIKEYGIIRPEWSEKASLLPDFKIIAKNETGHWSVRKGWSEEALQEGDHILGSFEKDGETYYAVGREVPVRISGKKVWLPGDFEIWDKERQEWLEQIRTLLR